MERPPFAFMSCFWLLFIATLIELVGACGIAQDHQHSLDYGMLEFSATCGQLASKNSSQVVCFPNLYAVDIPGTDSTVGQCRVATSRGAVWWISYSRI